MHSADACLQSLQVHCSTACRRLSPVRPNYPSCSCEPRVLAISDDCFRLVITSQDCVPRVRFSFAIRSLKLIHSNCIPAHRNKQGKSWTLYESTWCDNNFRTKPKRVCVRSRQLMFCFQTQGALPFVQAALHAICSQ